MGWTKTVPTESGLYFRMSPNNNSTELVLVKINELNGRVTCYLLTNNNNAILNSYTLYENYQLENKYIWYSVFYPPLPPEELLEDTNDPTSPISLEEDLECFI